MEQPVQFRSSLNGFNREDVVRYMEYIYNKNRAVYDEYFGSPIHSIRQANYLQQEMDKLLASRKYRIGSLMANPWRMIKKWFKGWTKVADECSVCQKWKNNEKSEKEEE